MAGEPTRLGISRRWRSGCGWRPLSDAGALHDAAMTPASSKETANTVEWAPTDAALPREPSPPHEKQGPDQGQHREFERCVEESVQAHCASGVISARTCAHCRARCGTGRMAAHLPGTRTIITLILLGVLRTHSVAADGLGSLLVESDPAGASVYLNGRLAGETPVTQ